MRNTATEHGPLECTMSRYSAGTGMALSGASLELCGISNDPVPVFYVLSLGLLESGASATPIELRLCNHIALAATRRRRNNSANILLFEVGHNVGSPNKRMGVGPALWIRGVTCP
ncbi:hypothetical protein BQ8482_850006 [Mesorhizobium delmotii]|uniref:Uncharacterized protein n=1 Tax=Mesorhizobium delmotii TaxID=1631247 RepID=A0A2P9AWL8_9HYPH|nr:hypothetical protein BQ8482_850006 [Mesorhizobium delmotii]